MLRLMSTALLAGALAASSLPAQAGGYHHRDRGYHGHHHGYKSYGYKHHRHHKHHRPHRRGHDLGDEILLGAGIIGGAIVLNGMMTAPPPAPRYYAPPPQPYCTQEQVYRYLPDGRVQWGTRTRCY